MLCLSIILGSVYDFKAGAYFAVGASIAILPQLVFGLGALNAHCDSMGVAKHIRRAFYKAEIIKFLLTASLCGIAFIWAAPHASTVLLGFVTAQGVHIGFSLINLLKSSHLSLPPTS